MPFLWQGLETSTELSVELLCPCHKGNHRHCAILPVQLLVKSIQLEDGKMIPASHFFRGEDNCALELTEAELDIMEAVRVRDHFRLLSGCTGHSTLMYFVNHTS